MGVYKATPVVFQICYFKHSFSFWTNKRKAQLQAPPWLVLSPFMCMWSVCTCLLSYSLRFKWKILHYVQTYSLDASCHC